MNYEEIKSMRDQFEKIHVGSPEWQAWIDTICRIFLNSETSCQ